MINHKVVEPTIKGVMSQSYFTIHLSIIQSAGKRIFKIGEDLAKLQAKWLIVSCAPFASCPRRCWSRQINWITCVLRTGTVTNRCYVNRQINMSYYQQISNCCRHVLTYWLVDLCRQWLTDSWSCTALRLLFFVVAVVYSGSWDFVYGQCKQTFC